VEASYRVAQRPASSDLVPSAARARMLRGGPGVATRCRVPRTGADESTWMILKTRSSWPPEDLVRGDQGIMDAERSLTDDGGSRVIIRWARSAHSSDDGGLATACERTSHMPG
jgi:hypothetical protein